MAYKNKADQRASWNRWYERNKVSTRIAVTKRKNARRLWLKELRASLHCSRCPETHPACIQFHHRDPKQKELEIALAVHWGWGEAKILREIAKCDVLCANCHAKEHYKIGASSSG